MWLWNIYKPQAMLHFLWRIESFSFLVLSPVFQQISLPPFSDSIVFQLIFWEREGWGEIAQLFRTFAALQEVSALCLSSHVGAILSYKSCFRRSVCLQVCKGTPYIWGADKTHTENKQFLKDNKTGEKKSI